MKYFNGQVSRYLKRFTKGEWDELLSIDEMLEAAEDDDKKGYDPTGTTDNEDRAFLDMVFRLSRTFNIRWHGHKSLLPFFYVINS